LNYNTEDFRPPLNSTMWKSFRLVKTLLELTEHQHGKG